ncbi:hypothetical protein ACQUQU_06250 [Thalassolituus sp. LLYu03]|uniref:hypothetical protein n=1 Tax=Thalassolituus sp. LLYu03 TaxID=3421656 RepID=UPI003D2D5E8B
MATRTHLTASLLIPVVLTGLMSACSSGSNSSSTVSVNVQAGQEDIEYGIVRSVAITEGGQPSEDADGRYVRSEYVTDDEGLIKATIASVEIQLFELIGRVEDEDTESEPTTVRCQWVAGCSASGTDYSFGTDVARIDGLGWRSVVYAASKGETVRVTPLTDLVTQLAYDYVYTESADTPEWTETGYYSAYSVEQAVSQVSGVFDITSVQSAEPADLTQISAYRKVSAGAQDSIRYGALIAAWNHLAETYGDGFTAAVSTEFSADKGQMLEKSNTVTRVLTLTDLYQAAIDNLNALTIANDAVHQNVTAVVTGLEADIAAFADDTFTTTTPATLVSLFGQDDYDDFVLGIKRTKAFIDVMREYQDTFFEDGYKDQLDEYVDLIKQIGDKHADNLDAVVQAFIDTEKLYSATVLGSTGQCADYTSYTWVSACSYDSSTLTMTLNSGDISVKQMVADVNTTDDDDTPTSSHAIDVLITGTYTQGDLKFVVDQVYEDDDPKNDITSSSGVRVYFTDEVSTLDDPADNEVIGYEIRWSDFQLTDTSGTSTTSDDITVGEVTGSFRLFLRGVRDPLNDASDLHFNIDTAVLNGRISDVIGDEDDDDVDYSTVYIAGSAANASDYYPEKEFASFNGFFTPNATSGFTKGDTLSDLLTYKTGEETVSGQDVQYLDVYLLANGEAIDGSRRYRFYPTVEREDSYDIDNDDDTDELISTHDLEICDLAYDGSNWSVDTCDPKQRLYTARDFQLAINDLWEAGAFSRITVPGRGTYFVTWPVNAADSDGCLTLQDLNTSATSMDGVLYDPMVLGLTSARITSEVLIDNEPSTLFDMAVTAETSERYSLSAGLSHDYSGITSSDVYLGTGSNLDRIILSYDTDSSFETTGSLAMYKDGVSLSLDDGTTSKVDSLLTAYMNQTYNLSALPYKYITGDDGTYELCVTDNNAEVTKTTSLDDAVFYLNFRDVVYGRIKKESGVWIIRYIDGSFETL